MLLFSSLSYIDTLCCLQVFTFGSVPLKTYLPDGDIDLAAFSDNQNLKDIWANKVRDMLQSEEKNKNAEFRVKEVQYIQAEVGPFLVPLTLFLFVQCTLKVLLQAYFYFNRIDWTGFLVYWNGISFLNLWMGFWNGILNSYILLLLNCCVTLLLYFRYLY